jgi:hypothetical protein
MIHPAVKIKMLQAGERCGVQPNVEPYTEKFNTDPAVLVGNMIRLSEQQIDSATRLVIWPETRSRAGLGKEISIMPYYRQVFDFVKAPPKHPVIKRHDSYKNWGKSGKRDSASVPLKMETIRGI